MNKNASITCEWHRLIKENETLEIAKTKLLLVYMNIYRYILMSGMKVSSLKQNKIKIEKKNMKRN